MRLIDAEAYEQALIANDWDKDTDEFSTEGVFELLHDETTVKAIPLDKVKQAKEEMKECSYSLRCFNEDVFDEDERVVDLDNVLIILDKIIESEGK